MTQPPADSPSSLSRVFTIREAPGAGRGAFANVDIPSGTPVLVADDLTAHVLLREYRGEVCWECFGYDRGKKLPVRDTVHGFTFCSLACESALRERYDDVCMEAWAVVEKAKPKKEGNEVAEDSVSRPTSSSIDQAWTAAADTAASILQARTAAAGAATKAHRRVLQQALSHTPPADVVNYQAHTILTRRTSPSSWSAVLSLAEEPCPYSSYQELHDHVTSYLYLAAALPAALLPLVTPETLRTIKSREVHNSFGIRSLEDEGSEFFGYGVWPSASYFNHTCHPNVSRRREGRTWVFEARHKIQAGAELYISYLNGEEEVLNTAKRRDRLKKTWGFDCVCQRCNEH